MPGHGAVPQYIQEENLFSSGSWKESVASHAPHNGCPPLKTEPYILPALIQYKELGSVMAVYNNL